MSDSVARQLGSIVGDEHVLDEARLEARSPGYCATSQDAGLLVRPQSTEELAAVVRIASDNKLSIVPQGGLTGLVQGTSSEKGNIIVSFERMNQVLRVDPLQSVLIAESGTTLANANAAAAEHGMTLGVDIPSRDSCTVGGIVSTNAGGVRVIRYGVTRDNVLGLTAVLADGTVIDASNTLVKNNAGFDLKHLFIGSEGTLGLVTKVVFKLYPKPVREHTALVAANSFDDIQALLARCRQDLGASLLSFELMYGDYYSAVTGSAVYDSSPPITEEHPVFAIIEAGVWRAADNVNPLEETLGAALEEEQIVDAVLSNSEHDRLQIWRTREDSDALRAGGKMLQSFDIGFELGDIGEFVAALKSTMSERWPGKPVYVFGHMGDGNLHIVLVNEQDEHVARHHEYEAAIYETTARFHNSTVSAEHGIGLEKQAFLHKSRSAEQMQLMKKLQLDLDPNSVFNPGKIVA